MLIYVFFFKYNVDSVAIDRKIMGIFDVFLKLMRHHDEISCIDLNDAVKKTFVIAGTTAEFLHVLPLIKPLRCGKTVCLHQGTRVLTSITSNNHAGE